jgi:hypothetical protein
VRLLPKPLSPAGPLLGGFSLVFRARIKGMPNAETTSQSGRSQKGQEARLQEEK